MYWLVAFAANVVTALSCGTVAYLLARRVDVAGPGRVLPFGTALVFFSIAGAHAARALQFLYIWFGVGEPLAGAARTEGGDWHVWITGTTLAAASLLYLRYRGRYGALLHGAALYEDLHEGHRRALGLHDTVVQTLTQASWAMELGQTERAKAALDRSLEHAQRLGQEPPRD